ncbi:MAG: hypothetical protein MRY21_06855 [Simkaniaceae bacterium]|nr:hypothetical protein [Simkaniaceae bacterium]
MDALSTTVFSIQNPVSNCEGLSLLQKEQVKKYMGKLEEEMVKFGEDVHLRRHLNVIKATFKDLTSIEDAKAKHKFSPGALKSIEQALNATRGRVR